MIDTPTPQSPRDKERSADPRQDRLKAALKANLARRKAQARVRKAGDAVPDGAAQEPGGQD